MWDRVRKFLGQDEEPPGDTTPPPEATPGPPAIPHAAAPLAGDGGAATRPDATPEQVEETAPNTISAPVVPDVDVAGPDHAPQGLAAEAGAAEPAPVAEPVPVMEAPAPDQGGEAAPADAPTSLSSDTSASAAQLSGEAVAPASEVSSQGAVPPDAAPAGESDAASSVAMLAETADQPADIPAEAPQPAQAVEAAPVEQAAPEVTPAEPSAPETGQADTVAPATAQAEPAVVTPEQEDTAQGAGVPAAEAVGEPATAAAEEPAATEQTAPLFAPLAPGTVIAGRYTITRQVKDDAETPDTLSYQATDARSYERCWSCGSGGNTPSTRFCQNCGAPIQDHPVTLVQTREPAGEEGEVEQDGSYFHVEPERRLFGAEGIGVEIGAYSAEGPHHPNEDSYWYTSTALCANSGRQSMAVVVFADGMGGYAPGSGLISSRIAATAGESMLAALGQTAEGEALDAAGAETIMRQAIAAANGMVLDEIARTGEMGATFVGVIVHGDTAYLANVGDSRAYYIDPHGRATAITRDQSLVAQEVREGHLAENDIYTAVGNNIILHAIGEPGVEGAADCYTQPLEPDSYLLVCSDGYWKTLHGAVMPAGTLDGSATLAEAARRMVDDALVQGSDDNTTVVLIAIN